MSDSFRLGFGCAPVMGKVGKSTAVRAMDFAFERGVTHFDIARSYGFGRAESVLGAFSRGKRDKITITSKFGVVPPRINFSKRLLIPVSREISHFLPSIKTKLKRQSGKLLATKRFDATYAAQCLEASLKELKTDYLDYYLLHEPREVTLTNLDGLYAFLERQKAAGKILAYGTALYAPRDVELFSRGGVIQFESNITTLPRILDYFDDLRSDTVFLTRPYAGGAFEAYDVLVENFNRKNELDLSRSQFALALAASVARKPVTAVVSMFSLEHVDSNILDADFVSRHPEVVDSVLRFCRAFFGGKTNRSLFKG